MKQVHSMKLQSPKVREQVAAKLNLIPKISQSSQSAFHQEKDPFKKKGK